MRPYSLREIAGVTGSQIVSGDSGRLFTRVSIDSRKVEPGDLFFAIVGERSDGHDFVADTLAKGAGGAVCEHLVSIGEAYAEAESSGFGILMAESTVRALRDLAGHYRNELPGTFIGVTGSVGKTSTKDFVVAVLSKGFPTYGNPGNLNSHIGLPLALLAIDSPYRYTVLEMAMRKRGEIEDLCLLSKPEIGILTDISVSHIGVLGSIDEIALSKAELLEALPPHGLAVMCGDNEHVREVSTKAKCKKLFYGFGAENDVRAAGVEPLGAEGSKFVAIYKGDKMPMRVCVPGVHQVQNSLAAVALGLELGVAPGAIREGLESAVMSPMRLDVKKHGGLTVLNDAYNASPKSMQAALDLLEATPGKRKVAVLGDMLELGSYGPSAHREVGEYAAKKADLLVAVGELAKEIASGWDETGTSKSSSWFLDKASAEEHLRRVLRDGDACLVKASRGMGFESIVAFLSRIGELLT